MTNFEVIKINELTMYAFFYRETLITLRVFLGIMTGVLFRGIASLHKTICEATTTCVVDEL